MALILARGRRRDRFDGPRVTFDDISAEAAVSIVNAIAAALRADLASRIGASEADERLGNAARALLSGHDEGSRLEARLFDLVHALDRAKRLDDQLIRSALEEAEVSLVAEALARRARIGFDSAWEYFTGGGGRLAILLRMAGLSRDLAGEVVAVAAQVVGSDAESEIHAFDQLEDEEIDRMRRWLRLDPDYRAAIGALGAESGERTV